MQDDADGRGQVRRQAGDDPSQRLHATRRRADHDEIVTSSPVSEGWTSHTVQITPSGCRPSTGGPYHIPDRCGLGP